MTIPNLYISDRGALRLAKIDDTLTLGEAGRGRHLVTIQSVGGREAPRDGEPVCARAVNRDTVALSVAAGRARPLVIVRTNPGYSRGCSGYCTITGSATEIATGQWAYGDAGRTGSGYDAIIEITGPTGLDVRDGQLVLADTRRVEPFTRRSLVAALLADEDPWIRETIEAVVRAGGEGRTVWAAVLAEIEAAEAASVDAPPEVVHHGVSEGSLRDLGIALQGSTSQGLALAGDVAVAGPETWAVVYVSRGGGKRWHAANLRSEGVTLLRERGDVRLYRIDSPEWRVDYDRHQDGRYCYTVTAPEGRSAPEAPVAAAPSPVAPAPSDLRHNPFAALKGGLGGVS